MSLADNNTPNVPQIHDKTLHDLKLSVGDPTLVQ